MFIQPMRAQRSVKLRAKGRREYTDFLVGATANSESCEAANSEAASEGQNREQRILMQ